MTIATSARAPDLRGSLAMTHLHGRLVYTRGELQERTGLSQRPVEQLYYDRETNGHPEFSDKVGRAMVWDAEEWDAWWANYSDTTGLATFDTLATILNRSLSRLRDLWADRENNGHPEPRKYLQGTPWFDREEYLNWSPRPPPVALAAPTSTAAETPTISSPSPRSPGSWVGNRSPSRNTPPARPLDGLTRTPKATNCCPAAASAGSGGAGASGTSPIPRPPPAAAHPDPTSARRTPAAPTATTVTRASTSPGQRSPRPHRKTSPA